MKILFINTNDEGGGATKVALSLSVGASLEQSQAFWLVADKKSTADNVATLPFSIWRKRLSQLRGTDLDGFLSKAIFEHPFYQAADIVHLHNLHGYYFDLAILAQICREKKVVWTFHDLWPLSASCSHTERWDLCNGLTLCHGPKLYPRFFFRRQKKIIKQKLAIYQESNFTIVAPCQWMQAKVKDSALASKNCELIYNGIDPQVFHHQGQTELRQKLGLPLDQKIAIFLADGGSANRWKGWSYFEQIREHYADQLFFISIGHHNDDLIKTPNYWQLPYLAQAEVAKYLALADVFLFTSVAENFPLVVLEAMASQLPVISFDVGGVKEVLSHQVNGYLALAESLGDFARGVDWFLALDDNQLQSIKQANLKLIESNFTSQIMTAKYYDLYRRLLKQD